MDIIFECYFEFVYDRASEDFVQINFDVLNDFVILIKNFDRK